ncbi:MAG TPA: response regulator [Planctomycetota bacterium]|nr:response regulator [Planctomycetota bacterium]
MMGSSPLTVLLVEGDPDQAIRFHRALESLGRADALVGVVRDVDEALAYLSGQGQFRDRARHPLPRLVLLDPELPSGSGLEVLRWMRRHPDLRLIPVVVWAGTEKTSVMNRAYEWGANSFILKPSDSAAAVALVERLLTYWGVTSMIPETASPPSTAAGRPPSRVLLVEDDPATRAALGSLLEERGYRVLRAADGREAIELLRATPDVRVVILDLVLPVMDGWRFRAEMSADPKLASIPVVAISAYGDRVAANPLPGVDYFDKPLKLDAFFESIRRHCA